MTGPAACIEHARRMREARTPDELAQIARIKRLEEIASGDVQLLRAAVARDGQAVRDDLAVRCGLSAAIVTELLVPGAGTGGAAARLWSGWQADLEAYYELQRRMPERSPSYGGYRAWRAAQLTRLHAELSPITNRVQTYPVAAFELSQGCRIGCAFCGVAAERYVGSARHAEAGELWRGLLRVTRELFGPAAATSPCYWATDPLDNPDYEAFAVDFARILGAFPRTTTAAPLRDLAQTRRVLAAAEACGGGFHRFSILSRRQLAKLHAAFTPDELLKVTLVPQFAGSRSIRARAGRAFDAPDASGEHATIACVVGFIVNLPGRRIELVAPCRATVEFPKGYRVYGQATFEDLRGFGEAARGLIDRHCAAAPQIGAPLRFSRHLSHRRQVGGLSFTGLGGTMLVEDEALSDRLYADLETGGFDIAALTDRSARTADQRHGVGRVVQQLLSRGLVEATSPALSSGGYDGRDFGWG